MIVDRRHALVVLYLHAVDVSAMYTATAVCGLARQTIYEATDPRANWRQDKPDQNLIYPTVNKSVA